MKTDTSTRDIIISKFTVGASAAIQEYDLNEHNMFCLLVGAEKNAIDDCGTLASITRKHIEDAAKILGIVKSQDKKIIAKIESSDDVNKVLFDAINNACDANDLESALARLLIVIVQPHPLYWFYKGGHHIAIHTHNHKHRIAIITDQ